MNALFERMKLSVPFNHDLGLLRALEPVSELLSCLFLPFHPSMSLSARSYAGPETIEQWTLELSQLVAWCEETGLGVNLLANAPAWAIDVPKLVPVLEDLKDLAEIVRVTFSDLPAARKLRRILPWVTIGVSCLADVRTPVQAMWWKKEVLATHLTISREINRRPQAIEALSKSGMTLGMVAFDDCVPGCQARSRHFVPPSKADDCSDLGTFVPSCDPASVRLRREKPWLLARKEILPGHLEYLQGMVSEIKISGRNMSTDEIMRRVHLYLEARSLIHPNGLYSEPPSAWDHLASCDGNCSECTWCEHNLSFASYKHNAGERQISPGQQHSEVLLDDGRDNKIRIWLDSVDPNRPPVLTLGALGLYYSCIGDIKPSLIDPLLQQVGAMLKKHAGDIASEDFRKSLLETRLVGGFYLVDGHDPD